MKKLLTITLVMVFVLGLVGVALAEHPGQDNGPSEEGNKNQRATENVPDHAQANLPFMTLEPDICLGFEEGTVELSDTQEAGKWYTDRKAPAGFASEFYDDDWRLKHSIEEADSEVGFTATQGRKYDTEGATKMSIDLYIPADWETTDRRMAGFWATGFDVDDGAILYPLIEFTSDGDTPRFRVWSVVEGGWVDLGLPTGFEHDQWHALTMELTADNVILSVGDLTHTIDNSDAIRLGNVILQGYNHAPGATYDIYWDNFCAWY